MRPMSSSALLRAPSADEWLAQRVRGPRAVLLGAPDAATVVRLARDAVELRCVTGDDARALSAELARQPKHVRGRVRLLPDASRLDPESANAVLILGLGRADPRLPLMLERAGQVVIGSGAVVLTVPWETGGDVARAQEETMSTLVSLLDGRFATEALDLLDGALGAIARPADRGARPGASQALGRELRREVRRVGELSALIADLSVGISTRDRAMADLEAELQAARLQLEQAEALLGSARAEIASLSTELADRSAATARDRLRTSELEGEARKLRAVVERAAGGHAVAAMALETRLTAAERLRAEQEQEAAAAEAARQAALADAAAAARATEPERRRVSELAEAAERSRRVARMQAGKARVQRARDEARVAELERALAGSASEQERLQRELTEANARRAELASAHDQLVAEHERVSDRLAVRARQIGELRASRLHRLARAAWHLRHPRRTRPDDRE